MTPNGFKLFLKRWLFNTVGVLVAANMVTGIGYERPASLFIASLLLGLLNAFLRPLLLLLSLPLVIFTFGLFTFVINACLLLLVGRIMHPHFHVDSFWPAFWGAVIISIVSMVLNVVTGTSEVRVQRSRPQPPRNDPNDGGGPVIDV